MIEVSQSKALTGELLLPGDKSISHRAIILGALANGTTEVENFLCGDDTLATVTMFKQLGVEITDPEQIKATKKVMIKGVGLDGLHAPTETLDAQNSGTAFRLMLGVLAGQNFKTQITGDSSLQKRPMKRVTEPLSKMGAVFNSDLAPILVTGKKLKGIGYSLPIPSAQVKSAVLLAGLQAKGQTTVIEPIACRDHTERMLKAFGAKITREAGSTSIESSPLTATKVDVPADISSAAFFIVAALLVPGSELLLKNVGLNKTRTGVLTVLKQMGADITVTNERSSGNEPIGDLKVKHSELTGINLGGDIIPTLIDEIPILAVAMTSARGRSIISNAEELRVKESDRISTTISMLKAFGAHVTSKEDGFIIEGDSDLIFGDVDSFGDHRIAMSGVVLGLLAKGKTCVNNTNCINTSFPGFAKLLINLGADTLNDKDD